MAANREVIEQRINDFQAERIDLSQLGPNPDLNLAAHLLIRCVRLQVLDLSNNQFGPNGMQILAPALVQCKILRILILNGNNLGSEGIRLLVEKEQKYLELQTLSLGNNHLLETDMQLLSTLLENCPQITELRLSNNPIGHQGLLKLGPGLKRCKNLQILSLNNNKLGVAGLQILERLVTLYLTRIQKLNLWFNALGADESDETLLRLLLNSPQITALSVGGNSIIRAQEEKIQNIIERNKLNIVSIFMLILCARRRKNTQPDLPSELYADIFSFFFNGRTDTVDNGRNHNLGTYR